MRLAFRLLTKICIRSSAVHSPTTQQSAFNESSQSSTLQWLRRAVCSRLRPLKWRLLSSHPPPTHAAAHRAGKLLSIVQLCCCVGSKSDRKDEQPGFLSLAAACPGCSRTSVLSSSAQEVHAPNLCPRL